MAGPSGTSPLHPGQRLSGLLLLLICGAGIRYVWHSALVDRSYSRAAAALLPAFAVLGLGLALFPFDVNRIRTELDLNDAESFPRLPTIWQYTLLAAVLAGLGNWYAIALSL